ncbi:MAG: HNH endonuclease [Candidatus Marinimicrobia bacterium]|nr:HNH endonuclease [Candidatus Neomarinimicrobiota bacterium]
MDGRKAWKESGEKRKGIPYKKPVKWTCEVCGKIRTISRGNLAPSRKLRFCSSECANKALTGENNPAWRGGHPKYYGPDWRPLQREARKLDEHLCQRCGISQKEIGKSLDVHHIKPVSSFEISNDANYIENLVSLCHDCHMLVEWNGVDFELPIRCKL